MTKVQGGVSSVAGRGGYAGKDFKKGEVIMRMEGKQVTEKEVDAFIKRGVISNDDPFQVSETHYIVLEGVSYLLNHSCNPNAGIRGGRTLAALRDIKRGDEIFYDYSTTVGKNAPGESPWRMRCRCGAKTCRKNIGNWQTLPKERFAFYKREKVLSNYILKQLG